MSYAQWKSDLNKIPFFRQSSELKELTTAYSTFAQRPSVSHVERLAEAYGAWSGCGQYGAEVNVLGAALEQELKADAGLASLPTQQPTRQRTRRPTRQATFRSAYDAQKVIDGDSGAVTMLAYKAFVGGHTHLCFEYMKDSEYNHLVFHLCALGGGFCGQSCTGTTACVLKNVPVGRNTEGEVTKYGYVGGQSAFDRAVRKHKGTNILDKDDYELKDLGNRERNLPNNAGWTSGGYESKTVRVLTDTARKGHRLCRHLIDNSGTDRFPDLATLARGIETERFHKTNKRKGTNCVQFAMQVLEALDIRPNKTMKFHAWSSPPRAIKYGKLIYLRTT